jgi:hypothetical protein
VVIKPLELPLRRLRARKRWTQKSPENEQFSRPRARTKKDKKGKKRAKKAKGKKKSKKKKLKARALRRSADERRQLEPLEEALLCWVEPPVVLHHVERSHQRQALVLAQRQGEPPKGGLARV